MDPLALLEKKFLDSANTNSVVKEEDEETGINSGKSKGTHAAEINLKGKDEGCVIACYTYPTRESQEPYSEKRHSRVAGNASSRRSRSRSRERQSQSHIRRQKRFAKTKDTQHSKDVTDVTKDSQSSTERNSSSLSPTSHKMSALDRMILRQEQLLMRQSQKFLSDVKSQRGTQ
ncbi:uncharacterized protein BXIN_0178 [Babesia sp. Xinjiang]|uniref:uncharacterized protein n=1 Tax=Babesia sp. Xinjiang TaxID=462227 RepID=UPI000A24C37A|nr:uncharacterized protein BXIN_0178 [Babesia sp. Xinjiang]ORM39803.1 hypothetical protein BXIN_0178 [Babesia sp. Xinjiang]